MQLLYSTNAGPRYHGSLNLCALMAWVCLVWGAFYYCSFSLGYS